MAVEIGTRLPALSSEEINRYAHHLIMPQIGMAGQMRLKAASVLLIGTGGLAAAAGMYLAAAGVGRIGILDFDRVDVTDLPREIVHGTKDVGRSRVESARDRFRDINPHIEIELHETRLSSKNALQIFQNYDVIVNGTDDIILRYLINDACVLSNKPNVYGAVLRFEGQATVFWSSHDGACYRCLHPEPPRPGTVATVSDSGGAGVLAGIIAGIQASESLKIILEAETLLIDRLLIFDAWDLKLREQRLNRNPNCPVCGESPITALIDYETFDSNGRSNQRDPTTEEITASELKRRLDAGDDLQLIDVREPFEWEIARIPGARLIPLAEIVGRAGEIDPGRETVIHCKVGLRSPSAVKWLRRSGFAGKLSTLKGGINAWSDEVDSRVPKY